MHINSKRPAKRFNLFVFSCPGLLLISSVDCKCTISNHSLKSQIKYLSRTLCFYSICKYASRVLRQYIIWYVQYDWLKAYYVNRNFSDLVRELRRQSCQSNFSIPTQSFELQLEHQPHTQCAWFFLLRSFDSLWLVQLSAHTNSSDLPPTHLWRTTKNRPRKHSGRCGRA